MQPRSSSSLSSPRRAGDNRCKVRFAVAVIACTVAIAACASSGRSSNGSGASSRSGGIAFADCMRAHGIANFPDSSGGGIQIPDAINPQSPRVQSAQKLCLKLLPSGGPDGGQASESQKLHMLGMSECMRKHGVPTFPDPVTAARAREAFAAALRQAQPGTGFALAFGRPGSFIAIPGTLINSPAFNQAAAACGLPGARSIGTAKASPASR
jgi:hypothetical protein